MPFYIDDYIEAFWQTFENCQSKNDYISLLEKCELLCIEYLNALQGEEYTSFFDESPLLAMVSEVQQVCPEAVLELAEEKVVFSTAVYVLSEYSEDDFSFLRRHFLKKNDDKVIYLDFDKKKRTN